MGRQNGKTGVEQLSRIRPRKMEHHCGVIPHFDAFLYDKLPTRTPQVFHRCLPDTRNIRISVQLVRELYVPGRHRFPVGPSFPPLQMKYNITILVGELPRAGEQWPVGEGPRISIKTRAHQSREQKVVDLPGGDVFCKERVEAVDVTRDRNDNGGSMECARTVFCFLAATGQGNRKDKRQNKPHPWSHGEHLRESGGGEHVGEYRDRSLCCQ